MIGGARKKVEGYPADPIMEYLVQFMHLGEDPTWSL